MTLGRVLLPEAAEEFMEAAEWYQDRRAGLGAEVVSAVDRAIDMAADAPLAAASWLASARHRRWVLDSFPYVLVYDPE